MLAYALPTQILIRHFVYPFAHPVQSTIWTQPDRYGPGAHISSACINTHTQRRVSSAIRHAHTHLFVATMFTKRPVPADRFFILDRILRLCTAPGAHVVCVIRAFEIEIYDNEPKIGSPAVEKKGLY